MSNILYISFDQNNYWIWNMRSRCTIFIDITDLATIMIQKQIFLNLRHIICIQPKLCVLSGRRYTNECDRMWQKQTLTRDATFHKCFWRLVCFFCVFLFIFECITIAYGSIIAAMTNTKMSTTISIGENTLQRRFVRYILIYLWMTNILNAEFVSHIC